MQKKILNESPEAQEERNVKFGIADLLQIGMTFVVLGIALTYGADIQSDVRDDQTANSLEYNVSTNAMTAVNTVSSKSNTVALVAVAAVIIGILARYLFVRFA